MFASLLLSPDERWTEVRRSGKALRDPEAPRRWRVAAFCLSRRSLMAVNGLQRGDFDAFRVIFGRRHGALTLSYGRPGVGSASSGDSNGSEAHPKRGRDPRRL